MIRKTMANTPITVAMLAILFLLAAASDAGAALQVGDSVNRVSANDSAGKSVSLPYKNNVVVLAFWHPKCDACVAQLKKLSKGLGGKDGKGVRVAAVTRGKDAAERKEATDMLEGIDKDFVVLFDAEAVVARQFSVKTFPHFRIIDSKGRLLTPAMIEVDKEIRNFNLIEMALKVKKDGKLSLVEFVPKLDPKTYKAVALVGKNAPDIKPVKDLKGDLHSTKMYKGKKNLLVVFWSPKCPHCQRELPRLQNFYTRNKTSLNFEILAFSNTAGGKQLDEIRKFASEKKITFPVIPVDDSKVMDDYMVTGIPAVFIVDRGGVIREYLSGESEEAEKMLESIFETYPTLAK